MSHVLFLSQPLKVFHSIIPLLPVDVIDSVTLSWFGTVENCTDYYMNEVCPKPTLHLQLNRHVAFRSCGIGFE